MFLRVAKDTLSRSCGKALCEKSKYFLPVNSTVKVRKTSTLDTYEQDF